MRWVDEIYDALMNLDGAARYEDLYEYIQKMTSRELTPQWKASIRKTIEDHSSDSANFRGHDLFVRLDRGFWGIRGFEVDQGFLQRRAEMSPKEVVQRVVDAALPPARPRYLEPNSLFFLGGQLPVCREQGSLLLGPTISEQAKQVIKNVEDALHEEGLDASNIVRCTAYLTNYHRDCPTFLSVYSASFPTTSVIAPMTVGVTALPVEALVQLDVIAAVWPNSPRSPRR